MAGASLLGRPNAVDTTETREMGQTAYVQLGVAAGPQALFEQVHGTFANILAQANYPQPQEYIQEKPATDNDPWRIVAPGIAMRSSEMEERFGYFDFGDLRRRMTPEVFAAFV